MFGIRKLLKQILERLSKLEENQKEITSTDIDRTEKLEQELKQLTTAANRHDIAIEDLLDSWEEMQTAQKEEAGKIVSTLQELSDQDRKMAAEREKSLLNLLMQTQDQLFALQKAAYDAGAEEWIRQLALAERKLGAVRLPAGFQVIADNQIPVDYGLHEVINLTETDDPALKHLVAEIYTCGYVYQGKVLRKARVSVYRLSKTTEEAWKEEKP